MAIAAIMANVSRIFAWWREVDWRACAAYAVTGIPNAGLGARTLLDAAIWSTSASGCFSLCWFPFGIGWSQENSPCRCGILQSPARASATLPALSFPRGRSAFRYSSPTVWSRADFWPLKRQARSRFSSSKAVTFQHFGAMPSQYHCARLGHRGIAGCRRLYRQAICAAVRSEGLSLPHGWLAVGLGFAMLWNAGMVAWFTT